MEFLVRAGGQPGRLAILPGTYHPVTLAHLALAKAALAHVDEVLLVMPRELPHKRYRKVDLPSRLDLLRKSLPAREPFSIGVTEGGLFFEIAAECRASYHEDCHLWLLCGRDAAERIFDWDYGNAPGIEEQLGKFGLLVADRGGHFEPPPQFLDRIQRVKLTDDWSSVSASEVRRRIAAGEPWEHLVPQAVVSEVRRLYSTT